MSPNDSPLRETPVAPNQAEAVPNPTPALPADPETDPETDLPPRRRVLLPLVLFLATCGSTFFVGTTDWLRIFSDPAAQSAKILDSWQQGLVYMAAVMGILLAHEMGHFLTALWHRIPASLPYFIPVPILHFGTMGAVIGLQGSHADRRQLFDLGLAGPLAGLVVAVPVLWIGVGQLQIEPAHGPGLTFHHPLLLQLMISWLRPDLPGVAALHTSQFNPCLMAGWVGLLITGLNMLPVSQLDGGHVTYALWGRRAHFVARGLLIGAILFILISEQYGWVLMVVLVTLLGTDHPRTADDTVRLGRPRTILGWTSLAIPILCFPPMGIS